MKVKNILVFSKSWCWGPQKVNQLFKSVSTYTSFLPAVVSNWLHIVYTPELAFNLSLKKQQQSKGQLNRQTCGLCPFCSFLHPQYLVIDRTALNFAQLGCNFAASVLNYHSQCNNIAGKQTLAKAIYQRKHFF